MKLIMYGTTEIMPVFLSTGVDSSYASRRESLSSEMAGLAAPDDSRVLTLAEQIIAALPERIKVFCLMFLICQ